MVEVVGGDARDESEIADFAARGFLRQSFGT